MSSKLDVESAKRILKDNIEKFNNLDMYLKLISFGTNLCRFDTMNKALILIQNSEAFDVRMINEWVSDGRKLSNKARDKAISILVPRYSSKIIEASTGEEVTNLDGLTIDEMIYGLDKGLLEISDDTHELYTVSAYDIKDTRLIDKNKKYELSKPKASLSNLFKLVDGFGMEVVDNQRDEDERHNKRGLVIHSTCYKNIVAEAAKLIAEEIILRDVPSMISKDKRDIDIGACDIEMIINSLRYSICSMFLSQTSLSDVLMDDMQLSFQNLKSYNAEKIDIISIANIVNSLVSKAMMNLEFTGKRTSTDAVASIDRKKKLEAVKNIMVANYIHRELFKY